jgi:hypothetical protein
MENINTAKSLPITQESIERERAILHDAFEFDPVKREQAKKEARDGDEVFAEVRAKYANF